VDYMKIQNFIHIFRLWLQLQQRNRYCSLRLQYLTLLLSHNQKILKG
jgi:hypothetical protein